MSHFQATVIADGISPDQIRLTTMELVYPRFIHAEFMTHRQFSRNASSSRAIPTAKLIDMVRNDPAMPIHWGKNQRGMQAEQELNFSQRQMARQWWLNAAEKAADYAQVMLDIGIHKQVANRILEPFLPIRVVVTATEWANFFGLRRHKDAQPEIRHLADLMWDAMKASEPQFMRPGQWHLPYVTEEDWGNILRAAEWCPGSTALDLARKVSAARCARVSYKTHDGRVSTIDEDLKLYDRLVGSDPKHASPVEHQATPDRLLPRDFINGDCWESPELHGNFNGWIQARKLLDNECITDIKESI